MKTKEEALGFLEVSARYRQRMTYKYNTQSFKVFNTHEDVLEIAEFVDLVAKKNNLNVFTFTKNTFNRSKDLDFFVENKNKVNDNWEKYAFEQMAVYNMSLNILEHILDEIDEDLILTGPFAYRTYFTG